MKYRNNIYDHLLPNEAAEWGGFLFGNWPLHVRQLWYREFVWSCRHSDAHCPQLNLYTRDDFKRMGGLSSCLKKNQL